jgi:hypothetical protein
MGPLSRHNSMTLVTAATTSTNRRTKPMMNTFLWSHFWGQTHWIPCHILHKHSQHQGLQLLQALYERFKDKGHCQIPYMYHQNKLEPDW